MNDDSIRIGKHVHPLGRVVLHRVILGDDGAPYLSVDLHAASDGKTTAGFAINCLSLFNRAAVEEVQNLSLQFSRAQSDPGIELAESVITRPGLHLFDLEIAELSLDFGEIRDNFIAVSMRGRCFGLIAREVEFHARFDAEIK